MENMQDFGFKKEEGKRMRSFVVIRNNRTGAFLAGFGNILGGTNEALRWTEQVEEAIRFENNYYEDPTQPAGDMIKFIAEYVDYTAMEWLEDFSVTADC